MESVLFYLLPFLLLFIAVALRLLIFALPDSVEYRSRQMTMALISLILGMIAASGMCWLLFVQTALGIIGVLLTAALCVFVLRFEIRTAGARQRARQIELLWVLTMAVKSGRPLADEIDAYAEGTSGRRRRLLFDMADRLRDGVTLTELAVPQGLLPESANLQIHAGITSHSLADSLSRTAVRVTRELSEDRAADFPGAGLAYPPVLLVVASLIVSFLMVYIVPKLKKIFDDFNTDLPPITVALIQTADFIVRYWLAVGLPLLVYFPVALCVFVGLAEYYGWQVMTQSLLGRWFIRWHTPDVLRALSQSLSQDKPLDQSLESIVKFTRWPKLRKRLAVALDEIENGEECWRAFEQSGLLNQQEASLFQLAQQTGNLPWAMQIVADTIERRRLFRLKAILEIVQPLMLIPLGLIIGFVALGVFLPAVKLLTDMSLTNY